jgi:predicted ATPase/class 3 adenylate cyclase
VVCPGCGRVGADDDRFCGGCGTALTITCRQCGRPLGAEVAYCTGCGAACATEVPALATEDRRQVSVLFIDLIESTPYAEQSDPELVRGMQTTFYATARRVISQHGGVVEKYIGDAVMALFGAPVATETDVLRCVRAGLELQRVLSRTAAPAMPESVDMQFRVGVATGEALVDLAAARDGGQAIVAGDVVNTAFRLQAAAPPGGVLVCGRTRTLTTSAIRYAEPSQVTLRGHSNPTEVWLAVAPAEKPVTSSDDTPLVEREHELSLLVGALHRVVSDRTPQLVTLFGQAGIGKSRLTRELRRHATRTLDAPVTWRTGHCRPFGENVTYAALADIVAAEAGILDTDPADVAQARLARAVQDIPGAGNPDLLIRALAPLVGLPGGKLPAGEAESAWRRFLVGLASRGPTVLAFEDMHWADEPMLRFVELLAAAARDVPLLVLTTARPELVDRDASWAGTIAGSLTITLPPLRGTGIATLYAHLFGQATFTPEVLQPLVELAAGNPLYAQEYVRMLAEQGHLPPAGAGWPNGDLPTPDSVHAVIANRVDLLDPGDRAVLQAAAVVGVQFWPGAVAATLGRAREQVERALRRLQQREFVAEQRESAVSGESEFRFRHMLVRDVCYQRLPRAERVTRHERAADWLEAMARRSGTDSTGQATEVLAHHRWAAHEIARTVGVATAQRAAAARIALHRAARRAYELHALDASDSYAARALSLFEGLDQPTDRDVTVERLSLELLATEIAFYRDQSSFLAAGGADQLATLADQLAAAGAATAEARAWTLLGQAAWLRADRPGAQAYLERAAALFDPLPDTAEKVDAYSELGRLHMLNFERDPAIAAADRAAAIAERLDLDEARMNACITIAMARYEAGEHDALDTLRDLTAQCRSQGLLAMRRAAQNLAAAALEEGDWRRSETILKESTSEVAGGHNLATGYSAEAMRAYLKGDLPALAAAADAFVATPGWQWGDIRLPRLRACVRVLRNEPAPDQPEVADALTAARASGFRRPLWTALAWEAFACALQERYERAEALLAELTGSWQKVEVIASGEWVCAAAYAAALLGRAPAEVLRTSLASVPRHTRWSSAALHTVTGAVALAEGKAATAGREHLAAAALHADIPAVTDRMLSLALAADAFAHADEPEEADLALAEVREFAHLRSAPGLLRLSGPTK